MWCIIKEQPRQPPVIFDVRCLLGIAVINLHKGHDHIRVIHLEKRLLMIDKRNGRYDSHTRRIQYHAFLSPKAIVCVAEIKVGGICIEKDTFLVPITS